MSKETGMKTFTNLWVTGTATDVVDRFGSAVKEHVVGYSGVDYSGDYSVKNEAKRILQCGGLKGIYNRDRHNPSDPYYRIATKQQAGFTAEFKEVARRRAEEAIAGKKPCTVRTDDVPHHVNDPLYDITSKVDANGNPVSHLSEQMKFVGGSPKEAVRQLLSKKYEKYIENDVKMTVPSDFYNGIKADLEERITSLKERIQFLQENGGDSDALKAAQDKLRKCETLNKNLVKSKVSNAEAIEARNTPLRSTAKDVVKVAHRAGLEQAKTGAIIGGECLLCGMWFLYTKERKAKQRLLGRLEKILLGLPD